MYTLLTMFDITQEVFQSTVKYEPTSYNIYVICQTINFAYPIRYFYSSVQVSIFLKPI
jgi:hypothetical protein